MSKSNIQSIRKKTIEIPFIHTDAFPLGIAAITFLIDDNLKFFHSCRHVAVWYGNHQLQ